jgi:hypothetical protein
MIFARVKSITIPEGSVKKITANGVVLWEKITSRVPSEYQEVEYIKKTHDNTYIDLGFTFDTACTFYINVTKTNYYGYLFGAAEKSGTLRCMITHSGTFNLYGSNGSSYFQIANANIAGGNEMNVRAEMRKGAMIVTDLLNGVTETAKNQGEYTMTNNLYLFAQNYNGTARVSYPGITLKSFSYYDKTGEMICELIPCYRKADGVVGVYDCVRKLFLTNAVGTFVFSKGADI